MEASWLTLDQSLSHLERKHWQAISENVAKTYLCNHQESGLFQWTITATEVLLLVLKKSMQILFSNTEAKMLN